MRDSLLPIPNVPAGVEPAIHFRGLLGIARADAAELTKRLHLETPECLRDQSAEASTILRRLRKVALEMIERSEDDVDELTQLLGELDVALEDGEDVVMRADLRVALEHDLAVWESIAQYALAIGELSGGMFMGFVLGELRDPERLYEVEHRAHVPLMHALMRAVVAGFLNARDMPLGFVDPEDRIDELLLKTLRAHGPLQPGDSMQHLRIATTSSVALWNLSRIAQRDDMSRPQADAYARHRRDALASIRADTRFQQLELGMVPDYEQAYDVGVALAIVQPILARRAEQHDVRMTRRAHAVAWIALLGNSLATSPSR
jgi:hypothetical protein